MTAERMRGRVLTTLAVVLFAACGGGDDAPEAAPDGATPPPAPPAAVQGAARADTAAAAGDSMMQDTTDTGLRRETFAYRGAGRDPFVSLLVSGAVRPLPQDLRVTGITYDARYPQRSVAVVRDTTTGRRYSLRVGDQVGRIRVAEIRQHDVLLVLEEFGVERQVVLSLRRRQEGTP